MPMLARLPAAVAVGFVLASVPAQRAPMPAPSTAPICSLPAAPVLPPIAGQPLGDIGARPCCCGAPGAGTPADPATQGIKVRGADLKRAIAEVSALGWESSLERAKQRAAESHRPILWLQTLGDLDGFA